MNDLKMGFKQSLLQRLHTIEVPTTTGKPCTETKDSTNNANTQITDFSIQRILADNKDEQRPVNNNQDTPPTSPKLYAPVATKPVIPPSNDILDLSKSKATENYLNHPLLNTPPSNSLNEFPYNTALNYGGFHPNILAAMAAANAQKFYAQFLPQMFTGGFYNTPNGISRTQSYQKHYFSPYILKSPAASTNNPQQQLQQQQQSPLTSNTTASATINANPASIISPPSAATSSSTLAASKLLCSRTDCLDCLDSYYKASTTSFPYKSPILSPAASTISSTSSYQGKNRKEILNSLSSSNISLTAVTNIHLTTNKNCRNNLLNTSLANNTEEISYKCRICDKVFGCSQTLQAHEKTHKSPRYECTDCGKGFSQLRNYKYHLSVHRGTKEFAAECPECGKTFNDKGYLSSHMKIHRNKKEYECPYCPKSFNQRVAFNMHVRIHTGVKPHKCAECGKRFSRKMLLKQHMRTHSGEKPYQCSVCGKSFADRSNMTLHHRLHSGIKPFNCPICPKAFTKKHHLKTHLNYHTGCKPYVCPHPNCNQAFTQSSNMRTHAKKCQYRPLQMTAYPVAQKSNAAAVAAAAATNVTSFSNTSLITANAAAATAAAASSSSTSNAIITAASQATQNFILNPISRLPSSMAVSVGNSQHHGSLANIVNVVASSGNNGNNNANIPFIPSTTLAAGIRMLSTVSSTVPVTNSSSMQSPVFPPAQQPLLSTLRPF